MKTATVRELRNRYTTVLKWIEAGEDVQVTRRGKTVARLVPDDAAAAGRVDWSESRALRRDRKGEPMLGAKQVQSILRENQGRW